MNNVKPIENVLSRLKGVKRQGADQYLAHCPAHLDKEASLSVKEASNGNVLLYCHAGCNVNGILKAIGLEMRDLFLNIPILKRVNTLGFIVAAPKWKVCAT